MQTNSWLYHYYMVQSRLQYSLAYGSPNAAGASLASYYPHLMGGGNAYNYDASGAAGGAVLGAGQYFAPAPPNHHVYSAGYTYTPPAGAYNLEQGCDQATEHRRGDSPIDFSSNGGDKTDGSIKKYDHPYMHSYHDSFGFDRSPPSGPDYRSESTSSSPLHITSLEGGVSGDGVETIARVPRGVQHSIGRHLSNKNTWHAGFEHSVNAPRTAEDKKWAQAIQANNNSIYREENENADTNNNPNSCVTKKEFRD